MWSVQLTPPLEVEVQETPETFNVTWKSGYENHSKKIDKVLHYEVLLQTAQSIENNVRPTVINNQTWTACSAMIISDLICLIVSTSPQTLHPNSKEKFVSIPRTRLKPDTTYCIKVRSLPKYLDDYNGTWSKWSPSTCWKEESGEGKVSLLL